jgi:hypothetical protein
MAQNMRDALAFIADNAELFATLVDKKTGTIDVDALESFAVRGDALTVIQRKSTFTEESRELFVDSLFALAGDVAAGIKKSGTSGNHRFTVSTPSGSLTVELKPESE